MSAIPGSLLSEEARQCTVYITDTFFILPEYHNNNYNNFLYQYFTPMCNSEKIIPILECDETKN